MPVDPLRLTLLAAPLLGLGWVLLLLLGVPTWLVAAAVLRLW